MTTKKRFYIEEGDRGAICDRQGFLFGSPIETRIIDERSAHDVQELCDLLNKGHEATEAEKGKLEEYMTSSPNNYFKMTLTEETGKRLMAFFATRVRHNDSKDLDRTIDYLIGLAEAKRLEKATEAER